MEKTIIDKNGHSNIINADKIKCIKSMATKIIVHFNSGHYFRLSKKEQETLLKQLKDEITTEIHTQCSVKFPLKQVK